ncbi:hypothetical protein FOCC_FOCC001894 [Frankliniella occidentalis]|nr:hypothetical protein FOCC_FOCC001894 [Frankliniella occidentalis]
MGMLSGTKSPAPCREAPVYEVKLERVLGLTVPSNAALDCDSNSELIAYPAGCTVVLFNPRKNRQCHVLNAPRKTITCVAFSADGRYLATGECGHAPSVRVWDLHDLHGQGAQQVAEFPGHKYGINCVAFSPSHKYVVSVGSQHDMIVNVWDWRANIKVASNKVSSKVKAVSFAENGNYFVTVGNRHVKFWYLEYSRAAKYKEPVPLMGRSAILGEQRNNYFCDVACGRGESGDSTYAITKSGLLCEFNNRRLLDKWVELRTTSANCMSVGEHYIFIGCADGIVRCFSPLTLQFITTLPRTHYLGVDVAQGLNISHMASHPNNAKYPDAIALAYDSQNQKLTCVYNDHSLYVWDVRDIKRVGKSHSFLYHSACIWGVEMYPVGVEEGMPPGSFVTCSSDDTIRFWNLDPNTDTSQDPTYKRNIYSNELMKVLYVDPEMTYLKDLDLSTAEKTDSSYDGRNGVRSIRISPDGKHLASGDRAGNIRINEVRGLPEVCRIEAHDAEVLCLEYTRQDSGHKLLASASRDRLIHVFSVEEDYNFVQTLDDHSSSITAVRFLNAHRQLQMVSCGADKSIIFRQLTGSPGGNNIQFSRGHNAAGKTTLYDMEIDCGQKHILTACQDRNIRVYNVTNGKHSKTFKGSVGEDGSLIKVVLDPSGIFVATSCTDKTLCVYDYYSGECMATMLGHSELVTGLRFTNDCKRLVSASGDGCIFVWKVPHDMVVTMHARLAQQAARAGRRSNKLVNGIQLDNDGFGPPPPEMLDPNANSVDHADYRFSVGQLPLWAKKQIKDDLGDATHTNLTNNRPIEPPKGRWAQRLDATGITVKSVYDSDSVIPFPLQQEKRADSDGSKDSSIDSGTEIRHYSDFRRETMLIKKQGLQCEQRDEFLPCPESMHELLNGEESKQVSIGKVTMSRGNDLSDLHRNRHHTDDSSIGSYKYEDMESTEHDGDVEDYSEGEGESTEPEHSQRLIYYPAAEETTSVYTVNAMDVEELRRSQRRFRKNQRPERLSDLPLVSPSGVSGSQDSDDDDEEVSTPSADTAERNLMSMLSVSSESLDIMGQREKYLKNTFDSLSGAEQDKEHYSGKKSISSQYHGRLSTTPRNTAVINAAWQSRTEPETSRKREELKKRIEETRRKLQSVGYRSNLKSSQSIQDLSRFPEKERRNGAPHRMLRPPGIGKDASSKKQTKPAKPPKPTKFPSKPAGKPASRTTPLLSSNQPASNPKPTHSSSDTSSVPASKISLAAMTANRPSSLNLSGMSAVSTNKFRRVNRALNTNVLSLPESPVCDDLHSPTNSGAITDSEDTGKTGQKTLGNKNRSCTFYVDFNSVSLPSEMFRRKPTTRSTESILETPEPELEDDMKNEDKLSDAGSFSSDSLESTSEFGKPPRRCVSDYQIFNTSDNTELDRFRSASAAGQHGLDRQVGEVFLSQESILSDGSQLSSSADILQIDRHSSASFFLRNREACRSSESILTDESDYQFLFQGIGSRQLRDSRSNAQSTESILTDDSEMQMPTFSGTSSRRMPTYEDSGFETASQGFIGNENVPRGVFRTRSLHDTRSSRFGPGRERAGSPMVPDGAMLDSLEPVEFSGTLQAPTGAYSQPTSPPPLYRSVSLKAKPQSFFIPLDSGSGTDGDSGNRRLSFPLSERKPPVSRPPTAPKPEIKVKPVIAHKPPKPRLKMGTIPGPGRSHLKALQQSSGKQEDKGKSAAMVKGLPRELMSGSATWTKSKTPAKHIRGIEVKAVAPKDTVRTSKNSDQFFEKAERATVSPDSSNSDDIGSNSSKPMKDAEKCQVTNETISSVAKEISECYGNSKGSESLEVKGPSSEDTGSNTLQQTVSHVKLLSKKFESSALPKPKAWPKHMSRSPSVPCQGDTDTTISMSFSRSEDGLSDCNDDSLAVVNWDSGSSTPATSSSCANSPKRLWPRPVGLSIPGHTPTPAASNQLAKRLALRQHNHHQLLPSKCVSGTAQIVIKTDHLLASVDSDDGGTEPGGAIRRACSLSDLANPSPRRTPVQGKVSNHKPSSASRTLPRPGFKTGSAMTRSSSVGVLNQSDSESDLSLSHHPTPATRMNGLMRPTISSQNKMTSGVGGKGRMPAKRGLSGAFSSMNLSQVGNNEDSSSEEISSVGKPRQRSSSIDRSSGAPMSLPPGGHSAVPHRRTMTSVPINRFGGERDLVAPVPPPRPTRLRTSSSNPTNLSHQLDPSPQELPVKDTDSGVDLASAPLSHELISSITDQLMRTADTVVQLHKRLAMESTERNSQDPLLQGLEGAVGEAQRTLRLIAGGATNGMPVTNGSPSSDPALANKLQDLVATGGSGSAVTMMQQYSDLLLSLVQQRVSAPASANPGQSPTSPSQAEASAQPATD